MNAFTKLLSLFGKKPKAVVEVRKVLTDEQRDIIFRYAQGNPTFYVPAVRIYVAYVDKTLDCPEMRFMSHVISPTPHPRMRELYRETVVARGENRAERDLDLNFDKDERYG